jgi:DNA-binding MarR family transcriptional regulator
MRKESNPRGCTNLKLRQLDRRVTRHYDRYVAEAGLKNSQYALLSHVVKTGPVQPGELARQMQVDPSTLTRNVGPLVARGWLTVGAGHDARSRTIGITEAGLAKHAQGRLAWQRAQRALAEQLGTERVVALHALIDQCTALLDDSIDTLAGG